MAYDEHAPRGFGDTLARAIHNFTGIESCTSCEKRKEKLNKWIPYKKPCPNQIKLTIYDRIQVSLILWMRGIAFKMLIYMERKLARLSIAIREKNIKRVNNG